MQQDLNSAATRAGPVREPAGLARSNNRRADRANPPFSSDGRRFHFTLLDVRFEVHSDQASDLNYPRSFMGAYGAGQNEWNDSIRENRCVTLHVQRVSALSPPGYKTVQIHHSKHPYWDLKGVIGIDRPCTVLWPTRKVEVEISAADRVVLRVADDCPGSMAGEACFHVCRGLALYLRDAACGNLIHAAGVVSSKGVVLFVGGSNSGKTTLLTECIVSQGVAPLTNDRVLISSGNSVVARSWPSYASFCEGTLLRYPALENGVYEYEADAGGWKTVSWPDRLRPLFTKEFKRVFPMPWLVKCMGVQYVRSAKLAGIVFVQLSPEVDRCRVRQLNLQNASERSAALTLLDRNCFDGAEPSFAPWHGLSLPARTCALEDLFGRLRSNDVRLLQFSCNTRDIAGGVERLLNSF